VAPEDRLNGAPLNLHGTNNYQDHAGVGTAIADALFMCCDLHFS